MNQPPAAPSAARALAALIGRLAAAPNLGRVVVTAARNLVAASEFDRCTALLLGGSDELVPVASETPDGHGELGAWRSIRKIATVPAIQSALESGRHHFSTDAAADPAYAAHVWGGGRRVASVMIVPLIAWGEPRGILLLESPGPIELDADTVELALGCADAVAVSIAVGAMRDDYARDRAQAQLVMGTLGQASTQLSTRGVLEVIADAVRRILGDATTLAVAYRDGAPGEVVIAGDQSPGLEVLDVIATPGYESAAVATARRRVSTFVGPELENLPELAGVGAGRAVVIPLRRASEDLGLIVSFDPRPRPYSDDSMRVIATLASQGALSMHTVRVLELERATVSRLEDLSKLKTGFVAAVSHELRTPLTAILGFAEILAEQVDDPEIKDFIEDIRRESMILEGLIGNLLDTSRLEAGMLQLHCAPVDIAPLIDESVEVVRHGFRDRIIRTHVAPDLPQVAVDPVRFRQIVINLLENAAKYSTAGTDIDLAVEAADGVIRMTFDDRGPGIDPQYRERIFERFFRLEGMHGKSGTGIGLYLVRELVEAHGGTVALDDSPAGGARFTVEIPYKQPDC